ncbi:MAG: hypothetical protein SLAVMIC_00779 [uncultured marine phage]|uniref:Uncharacterized protein n=1 Tax=uncultured marine phage TaxID=707152 RepID=A0A8D9FRU0_9VIRU|nr:MAG: hypothetical protein SLAVMIC_00779 [uncultured marine phage]
MIREELEKYFYVYETELEELDVQHFEYVMNFDEDKVEDFKKHVIRELRLSKILDGKDVEERVNVIKNLDDSSVIWQCNRRMEWDGSEKPQWGNMDTEDYRSVPSLQPMFHTHTVKLNNKFESENPNDISDHLEEVLINKYRELALINRVKIDEFMRIEPFIVESTDEKRISAKITMAGNIISGNGRIGFGNLIIVNPVTYTKYKHIFENLEKRIFFESKFVDQNEIIVSYNGGDELPQDNFHGVVKLYYREDSYEMPMVKKINHRVEYGTIKVSQSAENFCNIITLV